MSISAAASFWELIADTCEDRTSLTIARLLLGNGRMLSCTSFHWRRELKKYVVVRL